MWAVWGWCLCKICRIMYRLSIYVAALTSDLNDYTEQYVIRKQWEASQRAD